MSSPLLADVAVNGLPSLALIPPVTVSRTLCPARQARLREQLEALEASLELQQDHADQALAAANEHSQARAAGWAPRRAGDKWQPRLVCTGASLRWARAGWPGCGV